MESQRKTGIARPTWLGWDSKSLENPRNGVFRSRRYCLIKSHGKIWFFRKVTASLWLSSKWRFSGCFSVNKCNHLIRNSELLRLFSLKTFSKKCWKLNSSGCTNGDQKWSTENDMRKNCNKTGPHSGHQENDCRATAVFESSWQGVYYVRKQNCTRVPVE